MNPELAGLRVQSACMVADVEVGIGGQRHHLTLDGGSGHVDQDKIDVGRTSRGSPDATDPIT